MSQAFFSKLDSYEKSTRLTQLGALKGKVTVWIKGQKEKQNLDILQYDEQRAELVLDSKNDIFPQGSEVLCSFYLKGMTFFAQVVYRKSIGDFNVLHFKSELYKSERRGSYRLLTFPVYEVWAEFDLGETYQEGKVIDLKTKLSQTGIFKNFLNMVENKPVEQTLGNILRVRVLDLSTSGMALILGAIEGPRFLKNINFNHVRIVFPDESVTIPEVKAVYVDDYPGADKKLKKYKVGIHFINPPPAVDDFLGKKINKLLREIDSNKDFEIFLK
jgi:hypothetical protein